MNCQTIVSQNTFSPPLGLRNAHVQTILSSMGPRQFKLSKQLTAIKGQQQDVILDCGEGVRLSGAINLAAQTSSKQLAILIHGWEGSIESAYIVSMTNTLLSQGVDVFRLNMRDHGDSHHLNEGIFNSTLIDEVIGGIADLQQQFVYPSYHLIGFSLGGNFSLRVAANAHDRAVSLKNVIAFCPVIHAGASNRVLNEAKNKLYGSYFVRKWKRSLRKKLVHFPEFSYAEKLDSMKTLEQMNDQLIPKYTGFRNVDEYFDAYALDSERLSNTICPCYLHFAKDDMIIPADGVEVLAENSNLDVVVTKHGGHCGFLSNWKFDSWQDDRALAIIQS